MRNLFTCHEDLCFLSCYVCTWIFHFCWSHTHTHTHTFCRW